MLARKLGLAVIGMALCSFGLQAGGGGKDKVAIAGKTPKMVVDKTARIKTMLNTRFDVLVEAIQIAKIQYSEGMIPFLILAQLQQAALKASLDFEESPEQRLAALKKLQGIVEENYKIVEEVFNAGKVTKIDLLQTQAVKVQIQIAVARNLPKGAPDESTRIKKMLKERVDVLSQALQLAILMYKEGKTSFAILGQLQRDALKANLDFFESPEERRAEIQKLQAVAEESNKVSQAMFNAGKISQSDSFQAKVIMLEVQIELLKAQPSAKPEEVRKLQSERLGVLGDIVRFMSIQYQNGVGSFELISRTQVDYDQGYIDLLVANSAPPEDRKVAVGNALRSAVTNRKSTEDRFNTRGVTKREVLAAIAMELGFQIDLCREEIRYIAAAFIAAGSFLGADDAEVEAVIYIMAHKGVIERDDKTEGRPVVQVVELLGMDLDLKELQPLTHLRSLSLRDTTDDGLKHIANFQKLRSLILSGTQITDDGLKYLAPLTGLQSLDLGVTKITDVGLMNLAPLTALQSLNLRVTRITDDGLKNLASLKHLQSLNLGDTIITDEGLRNLAPHTGLQSLNLGGTKITDAGLKNLAPLTGLHSLNLGATKITGSDLTSLRDLKQLQSLDLSDTKVAKVGWRALGEMKSLKELTVPWDTTDAVLNEFRKVLPGCRVVVPEPPIPIPSPPPP